MNESRWWVAGLAGVLLILQGCGNPAGQSSGEEASGDCTTAIRFRATIYTEVGFTRKRGSRLGHGEVRACYDTTQDQSGPAFPDDGVVRRLWRLPGFSVGSVVVGPEQTKDTYVVLASPELSSEEQRRLSVILVDQGDRKGPSMPFSQYQAGSADEGFDAAYARGTLALRDSCLVVRSGDGDGDGRGSDAALVFAEGEASWDAETSQLSFDGTVYSEGDRVRFQGGFSPSGESACGTDDVFRVAPASQQ